MINKSSMGMVVAVATLCSSAALALPDATQGNPLPGLGITTPDGVGDILRDHENPNTLYVGPANVKEINGIYSELDSSGAMCSDYLDVRRRSLLFPDDPELAYQNREYVSNYFQVTYAIPNANMLALNAIADARREVRNAGQVNADKMANYFALKAEWMELQAEISSLNAEQAKLDNQNTLNIGNCITAHATDPTMLVSCLNNNASWYQAEKAKIDTALTAPLTRKAEISQDYYLARGEYEALIEELRLLQDDIAFNMLIIQSQMTVASNAWEIEKAVYRLEEKKIVGRASAGYNLYDNEAVLLANAVQGHGSFNVKQLDAFNVRLNTGVTVDNPVVSTDNGGTIFSKNTWSYPADTLMHSSILAEWQMPFERQLQGDTIHFDTMDSNSFAAGSFDFYVTKGARCGEYTQVIEETYHATDDNGVSGSWVVKKHLYEPTGDRVIFAQSVGLNYNYYSYPGPLRGECSIDMDRMNYYWRNQGRSKKWRWFKTTTTSWDNIRTAAKDDMGMECTLDLVPETNDPDEAQRLTQEFEQHMYSDMWQMFLAVYAEEYTVEVEEPEVTDARKSEVAAALGTGLMRLCGSNFYCSFSGIVLRSLSSIGGTKAQGTTSVYSTEYGRIWKRYDKDTFALKEGSALINVKVCIDQSQC